MRKTLFQEVLTMTLIEDLRREIKTIIRYATKDPKPDEDYFKTIINRRKLLVFSKEAAGSYMRAIRILRKKAENTGKLISDKKLERILDNFLIDLMYDGKNKLSEIDKHIVNLFEKIRNMYSEKHLFIIPIMNLFLKQNICIGNVLLVHLNEQTLSVLESKYSIKLGFPKEDSLKIIDRIIKTNNTSTYAIVLVEAPDVEKATELAIQKADNALNILRLYSPSAPFVLREDYRSSFHIGIFHINLDKKSRGEQIKAINPVFDIPTIGSEEIEKMKNHGLEIINKLLSKSTDELTPLQKDILTAILWFGNAVKEHQRDMKFIKCVIALESLLIPDGGIGKGERLSKRFASILCADKSDEVKRKFYLNMRDLYDIRNSIIHRGKTYVHEDDLNKMMYWTDATIQFLLYYAEKYNNICELIKNEFPIDEEIYSDAA